MNDYDIFAQFYDAVMGDRGDVVDIIEKQISKHHPKSKTVLELGCGTGSILEGLGTKYIVSGIDQSANMLNIAQQKLPKSRLIHSSIAGFELDSTYDVIICVFDTINHLTSFQDWQKLFQSTQKHLSTNGLFIFDMNTIGRMRALAAAPTFIREWYGNSMDMDVNKVSDTQVEWHITIQQPQSDGAIQVYEERVHERSFPLTGVKSELSKYFTLLESFDSDQQQPSDRSDRIYFTCRQKP